MMKTILVILFCLFLLPWLVGAAFTWSLSRTIRDQNPAEGRFIDLEGGKLHVLEAGNRQSNEAVILLHGASSNAADIMNLLGTSLGSDARILSFDRPGHGWSDRLAGKQAASLAFQAKTIVAALDQLNVSRFVVVGHSYSGALALRIGLDHSERVKGMVLLGPVTHPWPTGIAWYYHVTASPLGFLLSRSIITPLGWYLLDEAVKTALSPQYPPPDYIQKSKIALALLPETFTANAEDLVVLKDQVAEQQKEYKDFKPPVTIFTGEMDEIVSPVIHSQAFKAQVPHANLIMVPKTGHLPHLAEPVPVREEIKRFIAAP